MYDLVYILSACNEWKEHASASIIGVFTDENKLKEAVCDLFKNNEIEWKGIDILSIENDIKNDVEEVCYLIEEDDEKSDSMEDEINEKIEEETNFILDEIMSSSIDDIDAFSSYIMIGSYELNELC